MNMDLLTELCVTGHHTVVAIDIVMKKNSKKISGSGETVPTVEIDE